MTHRLKTWPKFFCAVRDGRKSFELRKDDRHFQEGDFLILEEFYPGSSSSPAGYTGNSLIREVTYCTRDNRVGIPEGYVIMGIALTDACIQQAEQR